MIHSLGLELIRQEEGVELTPYQDVAGVWTVGVGHTGRVDGVPVKDVGRLTTEKVEKILVKDLERFEAGVRDLVDVELSELQLAALVSFAFNLGLGRLRGSTLLRLLNAGNYERAAGEFRKWRRAGGEIQPGLLSRRGREEQLFRSSSPLASDPVSPLNLRHGQPRV